MLFPFAFVDPGSGAGGGSETVEKAQHGQLLAPEFSDEKEKALRVYTTYGKKSLTEKDWTDVTAGNESNYNFVMVMVEMK